MAFYKCISTATHDDFTIEDEGILNWKKSVVIRPVYKSPPCPRGHRRGHGCGRGAKVITVDSPLKSTEKEKKADENDDAVENCKVICITFTFSPIHKTARIIQSCNCIHRL